MLRGQVLWALDTDRDWVKRRGDGGERIEGGEGDVVLCQASKHQQGRASFRAGKQREREAQAVGEGVQREKERGREREREIGSTARER